MSLMSRRILLSFCIMYDFTKKEFALFLWKEVEFYIKSLFFACLSTGVLAKKAL